MKMTTKQALDWSLWCFCGICLPSLLLGIAPAAEPQNKGDNWVVESETDWRQAVGESENIAFSNGLAVTTQAESRFLSVVKKYDQKKQPTQIVFEQSAQWLGWESRSDIGPKGGKDAAVFVAAGDKNYWYLNATRGGGVYGAWHSADMKNWTHYPEVTGKEWVTTAEYANGNFYIYYDAPNDEDPHLIIDGDLTTAAHRELGKVFADPTHGSDAGIIRDEDGTFHLFYEDWSPINARKHSWDSPLAGHSESPDGIHGFEPHEYPAPIDERVKSTGKIGTYFHPTTRMDYEYLIPTKPQNAYGDFTLIKVGKRYYLFCDYDPHDGEIGLGYWYSDSLKTKFTWGGVVASGFHPDPCVGFAEGNFYLFVQRAQSMISTGPWVGGVDARVGVDVDGDDQVDQWTAWQTVEEKYSPKPGFSKIIETQPAAIDLSNLPPAKGFQFEFKTKSGQDVRPTLDRVTLSFK